MNRTTTTVRNKRGFTIATFHGIDGEENAQIFVAAFTNIELARMQPQGWR